MPIKKSPSIQSRPRRPMWMSLLLALSLVPMIGGLLMSLATAVGLVFMGSEEAQAMVGVLFMLGSFAFVNGLQKKWMLAGGWGLPALALLLLVVGRADWVPVIAYTMMGVGVILLVIEVVRTMRAQLPAQKK